MAITKSEKRRKIANSPSAVTPKRRGVDTASPLANRLAGSPVGSPSSPITPRAKSIPLPPHLARMVTTHTAIESTLSMSLATSSRAPSQVTGLLPAITNTVALESAGLRVRCGVEELRRLCWLWEWDGCTLPQSTGEDRKTTVRSVGPVEDSSEDNPFLDSNTPRKPAPAPAPTPPPTDWVRGGMGLIVTPTTQLQRAEGRRVPAYGIGIKVEVTSDESVGVALSAVAKWTADSHLRRKELTDKLQQWVKLHEVSQVTPKANGKTKRLRSLSPVPIPATPFADLPPLSSIPITSTPSTQRILHTPSKGMFSTPSRGAISTPTFARRQGGFATPSSSSRSIFATPSHRKGGIFATPTSVHRSGADTPSNKRLFDAVPMTPTSRAAGVPLPPTPAATPSSYPSSASESGDSRPCTPCTNRVLFKAVHNNLDPQTPRKDKDATPTVPMTPRQAAMAERLRQRALATPSGKTTTVTLGYDAETDTVRTAEATPAELRRRCLLARLPDAAETLLAMFASRRIIPLREAGRSIVSASRCTTQEAEDEIRMLAEMCPKFLRIRVVERDEWVERGTGVTTGKAAKLASPGGSKSSAQIVSSPARKGASSPGAKVPSTPARTGSRSAGTSKLAAASPSNASPASATPRKAKEVEVFGLREIRELVRRELEGGI